MEDRQFLLEFPEEDCRDADVKWSMRQFIYDYNGNERMREIEDDPTGTREMPAIGAILTRQGREWKVVSVSAPADSQGFARVVRVFLSDRTKKITPSVKHLPK